jgi:hypothetical protein
MDVQTLGSQMSHEPGVVVILGRKYQLPEGVILV